jgi:hypothetical protein
MKYRSSAFCNELIKLNIFDVIRLLVGKPLLADGIGTAIGLWKWPGLRSHKETTWRMPDND